jgi:hypothetical protein
MDTSQLLREAWEAVKTSGVPESLQEAAFREAVEHLRSGEATPSESHVQLEQKGTRKGSRQKKTPTTREGAIAADSDNGPIVDEATFYSQLSQESGVDEKDLRDVLSVSNRTVHLNTPTKDLGNSIAEQARSVIALVAGARSRGLEEEPVDLSAVRTEVRRKRCYQENNFSTNHLGPMKGFNTGPNRNELVLTSKWVGEFRAAIDQALGRKDAETKQKD